MWYKKWKKKKKKLECFGFYFFGRSEKKIEREIRALPNTLKDRDFKQTWHIERVNKGKKDKEREGK